MSFNKLKQQEVSKTSKNKTKRQRLNSFLEFLRPFLANLFGRWWYFRIRSKQLYSTARQAQEGHSKAFSISGQQSLPALVLYSIVSSWQSRNTSPDRPFPLSPFAAPGQISNPDSPSSPISRFEKKRAAKKTFGPSDSLFL